MFTHQTEEFDDKNDAGDVWLKVKRRRTVDGTVELFSLFAIWREKINTSIRPYSTLSTRKRE